jgi:hypothetical protein
MYTALVLDEASKQKILSAMTPSVMEAYDEIICHHMTINMGSCEMPTELGKPYTMKVVALGMDALVIAAQVETDCVSKNPIKHVTLAVNRANGGKPFSSNKLTTWEPWDGPTINGTVQQCN